MGLKAIREIQNFSFMSLSRSLAHNTTIQIIGKAVSTALGVVALAILWRTVGTFQYGWYGTASGFLQFIGLLIDFGFTVTISNMLAEPLFDKEKLFNTVFTWRFVTALVFFGLAPFLILFFPYRSEIKIAVAVMALSFFAITVNSVFIGYYRQKLSMLIATMSEVLGRVVLVAGFTLMAVFKAGFLPMMAMITVASVSSTIYLIYKFGKVKFAIDKEISKVLYFKMWPTALSVIFNTVYLQGDRVILPLYATPVDIGLYTASYKVLDIIIQVAAIVMGMIMPLITYSWSRNLVAEFKERYQLGVDLLAFLLFPMVVGIFILSKPILQLIGGHNVYVGSGDMLKWLSISILGTSFGMTFGHIVLAINRQKQALVVYGSDAILSLIGYFIFIPRFGWQGAVGVTIFSEVYAGLFLTVISIYYSKVFPDLWTMAKITAASLAMGTLLLAFPSLNLLTKIFLGMSAYLIFAYAFRVIKFSTVKAIFSFSKAANIVENEEV